MNGWDSMAACRINESGDGMEGCEKLRVARIPILKLVSG
jgi:hypothetical protein